MADIVVAVFKSPLQAELTGVALERAGIPSSSITIVETEDDGANSTGKLNLEDNPFLPGIKREVLSGHLEDSTDTSKEAPIKTIVGCIAGCFIGAVIAAAAFTQPGFRAIVDAQPMVYFVGAGTVGGIVGGIIAALSSSSREYNSLKYYTDTEKARWVVAVQCSKSQVQGVVRLLSKQGGMDVKLVPTFERAGISNSSHGSSLAGTSSTPRL